MRKATSILTGAALATTLTVGATAAVAPSAGALTPKGVQIAGQILAVGCELFGYQGAEVWVTFGEFHWRCVEP